MDNQATRPDFYNNFPSLKEDKEAEKKGASEEERHLYAFRRSAGWKILKDNVDALLRDFDNYANQAIQSGMSWEEIGKNTVVINLARGIITRLVNKVEDAREACEKPDGTDK